MCGQTLTDVGRSSDRYRKMAHVSYFNTHLNLRILMWCAFSEDKIKINNCNILKGTRYMKLTLKNDELEKLISNVMFYFSPTKQMFKWHVVNIYLIIKVFIEKTAICSSASETRRAYDQVAYECGCRLFSGNMLYRLLIWRVAKR